MQCLAKVTPDPRSDLRSLGSKRILRPLASLFDRTNTGGNVAQKTRSSTLQSRPDCTAVARPDGDRPTLRAERHRDGGPIHRATIAAPALGSPGSASAAFSMRSGSLERRQACSHPAIRTSRTLAPLRLGQPSEGGQGRAGRASGRRHDPSRRSDIACLPHRAASLSRTWAVSSPKPTQSITCVPGERELASAPKPSDSGRRQEQA